MRLTIQSRSVEPDIVVLEMAGKILLGNESKQLEWKVDECLRQNQKKLIFDLSGVKHIDSTGVGIIVFCYGKLKEAGGELRLAGASGTVDQVLQMTHVDNVVRVYPSVAAAVEAFTGNR